MEKDPTTVIVTVHAGGDVNDVQLHEWAMDTGGTGYVLHIGPLALHLTRTPPEVLEAVAAQLMNVANAKTALKDSAPLRLPRVI